MSQACAHRWTPLADAPFHVARATWLMDYCAHCWERRWFVKGPSAPLTEDQPEPAHD